MSLANSNKLTEANCPARKRLRLRAFTPMSASFYSVWPILPPRRRCCLPDPLRCVPESSACPCLRRRPNGPNGPNGPRTSGIHVAEQGLPGKGITDMPAASLLRKPRRHPRAHTMRGSPRGSGSFYANLRSWRQAHIHEPPPERTLAIYARYCCSVSWMNFVEGYPLIGVAHSVSLPLHKRNQPIHCVLTYYVFYLACVFFRYVFIDAEH